jgi:ComF family protein
MTGMIQQLAAAILDLCLPRTCAGCRQTWMLAEEGHWCPECTPSLDWIKSPLCPSCGTPFLDSPESDDHLCGDCLRNSFAFDVARSAVLYAGVVRDRIHQLKFGCQLHWSPALVDLLVDTGHWAEALQPVDFILPVPLHRQRLQERGFNQAGLMAGELGRRRSIPVRFGVLVRQRATQPQTRLGRRERLENVQGAFTVAKRELVQDRSVLLIDDVFTTGTTLNECARVLKRAGAHRVAAVTVARVAPDAHLHGVDDLGDSGWRKT